MNQEKLIDEQKGNQYQNSQIINEQISTQSQNQQIEKSGGSRQKLKLIIENEKIKYVPKLDIARNMLINKRKIQKINSLQDIYLKKLSNYQDSPAQFSEDASPFTEQQYFQRSEESSYSQANSFQEQSKYEVDSCEDQQGSNQKINKRKSKNKKKITKQMIKQNINKNLNNELFFGFILILGIFCYKILHLFLLREKKD